MSEKVKEKTLGEQRCHVDFNPNGNTDINQIKRQCADLIDLINGYMAKTEEGEAKRCFAKAMTDVETAQMYAVKGIAKEL